MKKGLFLLLLLLTGCLPTALPTVPATLHPTLSPVISPLASSTSIIKKISTPTHIAQSSATPAPTSDIKYLRRCVRVEAQDTALADVTSGAIVQDNLLWDIQTGKKYPLRTTRSFHSFDVIDRHGLQVSPDRKMFAYLEALRSGRQVLWVVNARAEMLAKISFRRNDLETPRWLDNERLAFYTAQTDMDGSVLVVNPFTQEQSVVSDELPILNFPYARKSTVITWLLEYSPDLNSVVYLDNHGGVSLRDVLTKKTLWNSDNGGVYGNPVWSPDGQQVAVVGNGQIYLIDRSGQAKPILEETTDAFPTAPSWSPDGRKVAFWDSIHLMVYDLQTGEVVDLCVYNQPETLTYPARWSPDSRQLIIADLISVNPMLITPRVIDLQKNVMYKNILDGQNIRSEVWMNSMP